MASSTWKSRLLGCICTTGVVTIFGALKGLRQPALISTTQSTRTSSAPPLDASSTSFAPPAIGSDDGPVSVAGRPQLLIVVPGHGHVARTPILQRSLQAIRESMANVGEVACLAFTFGENPPKLLDCQTVNARKFWLEFLLVLPDGILNGVDYVLVLQDDVLLDYSANEARGLDLVHVPVHKRRWGKGALRLVSWKKTDVGAMVALAQHNCLDVLSPSLIGTHANYEYMRPHSDVTRAPMRCTPGRLVPAVEYQAVLFTREAFTVLVKMMAEYSKISLCWGAPVFYARFFEAFLSRPPKIGLLDDMQVLHASNETVGARCTSTLEDINAFFRKRTPPIHISNKEYRERAPKQGSATLGLISNCSKGC